MPFTDGLLVFPVSFLLLLHLTYRDRAGGSGSEGAVLYMDDWPMEVIL